MKPKENKMLVYIKNLDDCRAFLEYVNQDVCKHFPEPYKATAYALVGSKPGFMIDVYLTTQEIKEILAKLDIEGAVRKAPFANQFDT